MPRNELADLEASTSTSASDVIPDTNSVDDFPPEVEVQSAPFAMQVELVEGCNLRCSFCGLNGIRGKENNLKFMTEDTARVVTDRMKEAGWHPRIEFAMHGEPSLHPQLITMLKIFRRKLGNATHLMMTSNGGGFLKDPITYINVTLDYLNVLALDWYENVNIVPRIIQAYRELGRRKITYYPADKTGNPHRRRAPHEHDLVIVQDIKEATSGTHSSINNHAGCGAPKNESAQGKRCAKPFREISIRWDGSVAICCNDWRGEFKVGNVHDMTLDEIWQHPAMRAARRKLYHGMRDFGPCQGCDALSYRPGLLPDQRGKQRLPLPTQADLAEIRRALAGRTYTLPVLREWEQ